MKHRRLKAAASQAEAWRLLPSLRMFRELLRSRSMTSPQRQEKIRSARVIVRSLPQLEQVYVVPRAMTLRKCRAASSAKGDGPRRDEQVDAPSVIFHDRQYFIPLDVGRIFKQHLLFVEEAAWAIQGFPMVLGISVEAVEASLTSFTQRFDPTTNGFKMTCEEIRAETDRLRESLVKWIADACSLSGALRYLSSEFEGYLTAERRDHPEDVK